VLSNVDDGPGPGTSGALIKARIVIKPYRGTRTLRNYFLDRKLGAFPVHVSTIERRTPPARSGAGDRAGAG
jgi:hypothetical protein